MVSYLGDIELGIHFPKEIAGKADTVTTLALVGPDFKFNLKVPVLIGTNTLDILFKSCAVTHNGQISFEKECSYSPVIQTILCRYNLDQQNGSVGKVKLNRNQNVTLPAGQKVVLDGYIRGMPTEKDASLVVEPCSHPSLSWGLMLCSQGVQGEHPLKFQFFYKMKPLMKLSSHEEVA